MSFPLAAPNPKNNLNGTHWSCASAHHDQEAEHWWWKKAAFIYGETCSKLGIRNDITESILQILGPSIHTMMWGEVLLIPVLEEEPKVQRG